MKLHEAIEANKRFRRPSFPEGKWYSYPRRDGYQIKTMLRNDQMEYFPDRDDILADDWELEVTGNQITLNDFKAAWREIWGHYPTMGAEGLAKLLGLE